MEQNQTQNNVTENNEQIRGLTDLEPAAEVKGGVGGANTWGRPITLNSTSTSTTTTANIPAQIVARATGVTGNQ